MNITQVPHGRIHEVLPLILPYMRKMDEWCRDWMTIDGVIAAALMQTTQLWLVFDDDNHIVFYLTTEIRNFPSAKYLMVLNCGGEDGVLDDNLKMVCDTFEQFARASGCTGMQIHGRRGWTKYAKELGFEPPHMDFLKKFKEQI